MIGKLLWYLYLNVAETAQFFFFMIIMLYIYVYVCAKQQEDFSHLYGSFVAFVFCCV